MLKVHYLWIALNEFQNIKHCKLNEIIFFLHWKKGESRQAGYKKVIVVVVVY